VVGCYRWCTVYDGEEGGASNCGFLTIEQCKATVSGIGGFCEPNQFYNPRLPAVRPRNRVPHWGAVHALLKRVGRVARVA